MIQPNYKKDATVRTTLISLPILLTLTACGVQPGPGEGCDAEVFLPYCCSDTELCECVDGTVDDFSCHQFCENIGYSDGGTCDADQYPEDDHYRVCRCDGTY